MDASRQYLWTLSRPGHRFHEDQAEAFLAALEDDDTDTIVAPAVSIAPGEMSVIFHSAYPASVPYTLAYALAKSVPDIVGKRVRAELTCLDDEALASDTEGT